MCSRCTCCESASFTWNRASNLVEIANSVELRYDGRGYLNSAARPGFVKAAFQTDVTYSTTGRLLAYESTVDGVLRKYKVVYLAGRPVAVVRIDADPPAVITHYYTTDHLGTPILVTDSASNVHWKGGSEPFGADDASVLKFDVHLGFPGQFLDLTWTLGRPLLWYNVHRWYEPATGRYASADPLTLGRLIAGQRIGDYSATRAFVTANLRMSNPVFDMPFAYAAQNPEVYFDLDGRAVGGVIGGGLALWGFIEVWTCEADLQIRRDVCLTQNCRGCFPTPTKGPGVLERGDCGVRRELECQKRSNCFWELVKVALKDVPAHWLLKWVGLH